MSKKSSFSIMSSHATKKYIYKVKVVPNTFWMGNLGVLVIGTQNLCYLGKYRATKLINYIFSSIELLLIENNINMS